jgi:hypothetical protein
MLRSFLHDQAEQQWQIPLAIYVFVFANSAIIGSKAELRRGMKVKVIEYLEFRHAVIYR